MFEAWLLRVSLAVCAACAMLLPLSAHSAIPLRSEAATFVRAPRTAAGAPRERALPTAVRDPFEAPAGLRDDDGGSQEQTSGIVIVAIALGLHPSALVDDGSHRRLVGIGDALAGTRVRSIGPDAITLDDGRSVRLESAR